MKKLALTMMLVAMTAFGLTACGSKEETAAPADAAVVEEAEEDTAIDAAAEDTAEAADTTADAAAEEPGAEEIKSLAEKVKVALDAKDVDALSGLVAYPAYVGLGDGSVVEDADAFKALGDAVITPELTAAVDAVDMDSLAMVEAGVVLGDGTPNVILGVAEDGTFGITGINY